MNLSLSTKIPCRTLLLTVALAAPATAQNLATFVNGQVADANVVNLNFTSLKAAVTAVDQKADGTNTSVTNLQTSLNGLTSFLSQTPGNLGVTGNLEFRTNDQLLFGPLGDNTDSIYFQRTNPATNISNLRLVLGDDPASAFLDRFEIGTLTSTFNPALTVLSSGSVGVGVGTPTAKLDIAGDLRLRTLDRLRFGSDNENNDPMNIFRANGASNESVLGFQVGDDQNSSDRFEIYCGATGAAPAFRFQGNGAAFNTNGTNWSSISDARKKKNIQPRTNTLTQLLQLHGKTFEYIDPSEVGTGPGVKTGFIAQEVEAVFPEWVHEMADGTKYLSISGFEALTVEALRELQSKNEELATRAEKAEAENEALRARVVQLESLAAEFAQLKAAVQPLLAK